MSDAAVYNYHKTIKGLIRRALFEGKITANPYERLRGQLKRGEKESVEYLTEDEVAAFMSLAPVARFLREGQPVVNGNNCIIITYPNAMLCNHIMGEKQHFEAKQILKLTFGKEYDFIALPENVWNDKRNEYRGQYQMGMRFPKLTPINNPELKIIKKSF